MIQFLKGCTLFCLCVLLIAATIVCGQVLHAVSAITATVNELPAILNARLSAIQSDTHGLIDSHAKALEASMNGAVATLDSRIFSLQKNIDSQFGQANRSIASVTDAAAIEIPKLSVQIAQTAGSVDSIAKPIASLAHQADDAAPLFLDCQFNPDCAFNRFQGTSMAIERSAQAFASAAPSVAGSVVRISGSVTEVGENAARISADVRREVDALTKPKHWWQHCLDFLKFGIAGAAHLI